MSSFAHLELRMGWVNSKVRIRKHSFESIVSEINGHLVKEIDQKIRDDKMKK